MGLFERDRMCVFERVLCQQCVPPRKSKRYSQANSSGFMAVSRIASGFHDFGLDFQRTKLDILLSNLTSMNLMNF